MNAIKKISLVSAVAFALLSLTACGDDSNSAGASGENSVLSSSQMSSSTEPVPDTDPEIQNLSSSSTNESSSSKILDHSGDGESSSSRNTTEPTEESSSSILEISSSSSEKIEESSSSSISDLSSSSELVKPESSSDAEISESSSSISLVSSSSATIVNDESSSSQEEISSSSSDYYKASWDYLNPSIAYDTIIDSRDGQVYKVVTVGNQIWMAENLNYYDTIQMPELTIHSWCFNNDVNNCERRGRLYDNPIALDYDSIQTTVYKRYKNQEGGYDSLNVVGICPNGWRIPTRTEWLRLNTSCSVRSEKWNGDNSCGVSINSSGYRYAYRDSTDFIGGVALYWTSSYNSASRPFMIMFEKNKLSDTIIIWRSNALSIRCVKDN